MATQKLKKDGKVLLKAKLKRKKDGNLKLFLKADDDVETFYKNVFGQVRTSSNWSNNGEHHEFYKKQFNSDVSKDVKNYIQSRYDHYGHNFFNQDLEVNEALLRTKGISDGVEFSLDNQYSEETLINGMKDLKKFTKILYKKFIREVKINLKLTIEEL